MGIELVIVDDAPFIREAIRNCLESDAIKVVGEASNGAEALSLIPKLKPDIVLLDLVMPEVNGLQVAAELLKKLPDLKIIACSTESQNDMVLKALQAGCRDFISKPFTKDQMREKVLNVAGI